MTHIAVLGAGPAGLMVALEARERGYDATVIEASGQVGGMTGSFEVAGQRVDYGSHRLHPATAPELLNQIQGLLGADLQVRPRAGRIRLGGRWVGFPLRATNLVRTLPPSMTANLVADSIRGATSRERSTSQARSFNDEIVDRFGKTVADQFYGPFATKLYGTRPEDLSAELARRRVSASSPADIVRRLVKAARPQGRTFYYPKRGYGQIAERLAEAASDAGARIELNTPVTQVAVGDDRVSIATPTDTIDADLALSTIPVTALAGMCHPAPATAVTEAMARVRTRSMILVYLVLDRPQYTEFDAHYIPGLDTTVARLSEPKNYRDGDDPAGSTVLCAEIACWTNDEIWHWPADRLADLVAEDLVRVGLPRTDHVDHQVHRLRSVYPVYDIESVEARELAGSWTGSGDRLLTLGRQGLRVIDNLHHVLAMGRGAVEAVAGDGTIDHVRWQASLAEFAQHTVED